MVSSEDKPQNFPIYSVHTDMDSFILFNDDNCPLTDDNPSALEQQAHINQESVAHTQQIVTTANATSIKKNLPKQNFQIFPILK